MVLLAVLAASYGAYTLAKNNKGPATPSITAKPPNASASSSASFSFTDSTSGVSFKCSLDAAAFAACTSPKAYAGLSAGSHSFSVEAVSGSDTSSAASYTWTIDTTAPTATVSFPANGSTYNASTYGAGCSPAGLCGSASDPSGVASVRVSVKRSSTGKYWSGSGFTASSETFNTASGTTSWKYGLALPPDDSYTVHVQASDSLGNAQTGTTYAAAAAFTLDTVLPPTPAINSGPAGLVNTASASFGFSDSEAGVLFLCKLDNAAFAGCTSPASYSSLGQGAHSFQVEAKDVAGNTSAAVSRSWTVDTIPPAVPSITGKPASRINQAAATFSFSGESGSAFFCNLDAAATFTACTSPVSHSGLAAGTHTFQVEAKDAAGNLSAAASYTWTIDTAAPAITVTFPTNGSTYNSSGWNAGCSAGAGICGSATDPSGVSSGVVSILQVATGKYWNGSAFSSASEVFNNATQSGGSGTTYTGRYPLAFPANGNYILHARATDGVGNTTPAGSQVVVNFATVAVPPPTPTITSHPANPSSSNSASFSFTDSQAGVGYLCKLDTAAFAACTSGKNYSGLAEGSHTFQVEATSSDGTSGAAAFTWTVDRTKPPKPVFDQTPPNPNDTATSTFAWHDSEAGVTYECSKENGSFQPCTTPLTYAVSTSNNGEHQFAVRAIDAAGNVSDSISYKWKVDKGSPQDFTINGTVSNLLIGVAKAVPVTISNPNSVPIFVSQITIALSVNAGSGGCTATNFQTVGWTAGTAAQEFQVPANAVNFAVPAGKQPTVKLVDLPSNQDVCKNKTFTLTFSGSAHS